MEVFVFTAINLSARLYSDFNTRASGHLYKAPAKRLQHANVTYRNIVGCNMLRAFGYHVATCWVLLAQI